MGAVTVDKVIVELQARLDGYDARIARAERHFDRNMKSIQGSATRTERVVSVAMRGIVGALGTVSAIALARQLLSIADEAKNLNAQLRLATAQTGSFGQATEDVRRIAELTRSGLTETASLYGNFTRNAKDLGISQADAARATETVAKTFKISGANAVEAAQGTRQLVQALQSGVLRGDEFNTIMESSPRLARLLAESLGIPIGQLRKLAEDGQLTSQQLVRAFTDTRFTAGIDAEFQQLPVTFDQAMTQVKNAAIITFGAFDRGGEFSTALANFITDGTNGFADLEKSAEEMGIQVRATLAGLHDAFVPLLNGALSVFDAIGISSRDMSINIARDIQKSLDDLQMLANRMQLVRPGEFSIAGALGFPKGGFNFGNDFRRGRAQSEQGLRRNQGDRQFQERFGGNNFQRWLNEPGRYNIFGESRIAPSPTAIPKGGGKKARTRKGPSAETLAARAERQRQAEERRVQAFDNEEADLQRDLLDARRALSNSAEIAAAFEKQKIEDERKAYADEIESRVSQKKLRDDGVNSEAERLRLLNDQVAAERTKLVDLQEEERKRREELATANLQFENDEELLRIQQQEAETRSEHRDVSRKLLDNEYDRLEANIKAQIAEAEIAGASEEYLAALRERLANLQEGRAAGERQIEKEHQSPFERYRDRMDKTPEEINDDIEQYAVDRLEQVEESLAAGIAKKIGVEDPFLQSLIQLFIQQVIMRPIMEALAKVTAGAGGGGGFFGSLLSGLGSALGGGFGGDASMFGSFAPGTAPGPIGMARGGSFIVGGRGGIDRNVMAINDQPVALVGRGETVAVIPQGRTPTFKGGAAAMRGGQTIVTQTFVLDARYGIVTPQLLDHVNKVAKVHAKEAGVASYQRSMRDAPATVRQAQRFGNH